MNVLALSDLYTCCHCCDSTDTQKLQAANPPMSYSSASGTPTAQGITPPYPNLAAYIYDSDGVAASYGWNPVSATWQ